MDYSIDIQTISICLVGFIFLFVGIRNPWTISNDEVWIKIHRNTGKIYMIVGLIFLIMGVLNTINWSMIVVIIIICAVYPHINSFIIFRKNID